MNTKPSRRNGLTRVRVEKLYRQHPKWTLERYARRLGVSHVTVHYHLASIKAKEPVAGAGMSIETRPVRRPARRTIADPYGQIEGLR